MVKGRCNSIRLQRLWQALVADFCRGWQAITARFSSRPKIQFFQVSTTHGTRRFHLRTNADGSAVLFLDANEVIHLNATAATLWSAALQSHSVSRAVKTLCYRFGIDREQARLEAEKVFQAVERLLDGRSACFCEKLSEVTWTRPFSQPVSAPYKVDLALCYACNNACAHCYNGIRDTTCSMTRQEVAPLKVSQWRRVLRRLSAIGVPHVIFTGGEPTLFDGLLELISFASKLKIITGLNTNGRCLADRKFTSALALAGLDHVQITLESHRREVHNEMTSADSFDETLAGLENSIHAGLYTITNTTLTRKNLADALPFVDFLHNLGVKTFAVNGIIRAGGGRQFEYAVTPAELKPVLAAIRHRACQLSMQFLWYTPTPYCELSPFELELGPKRCNAGEYSICIEPNGDVLPCQSFYVPVGNILRDPWQKIWQSDLFLRLRRRTNEPAISGLPEQCWHCPDLSLCGGGCILENSRNTAMIT